MKKYNIKRFISLIIRIFNIPLYYLSAIFPKDKNLWIFGSWFGDKYADNSKYLFEYINQNHPEIKAIWLTKNKETLELIRNKGYLAYYTYSIYGIVNSLRAGASIFIQGNRKDNNCILNNGKTKLIQLWHGIPLKKLGDDDKIYYKKKQSLIIKIKEYIKKIMFPFLYEKFDLMIASSEEDREKFLSAFNPGKIIITGYPRNDIIKNKKSKNIVNIIYMPTFRGEIGNKVDFFNKFDFRLKKWSNWLKINNLNLYIKLHPVNHPTQKILDEFENSSKIFFLINNQDIYEDLNKFDLLITDYSSIYFDYLLSNKPIIFAPFDYKEYLNKDRELYYDYNKVTPGPKCKNWEEIMEWIEKFKKNPKLYTKKRKQIRNKFHKYQDGKNSERVFTEVVKFLKDKNNE